MQDYELMIADAAHGLVKGSGWTELRQVYLTDGNGTLIASNALYPRSVYYIDNINTKRADGTVVLPENCGVLYQENSAYTSNPPYVTIGKPPKSEILQVMSASTTLAGLSVMGNTSQLEQYLLRLGNPYIYNVVDLRVRPTDTTSSGVYVEAGFYERLSSPGIKRRYAGGTLDLSAPIAALTSGQHQLGIVYMDVETEALGIALVAASATAGTLPSRTELADLTSVRFMARQKALGTAYLYYGQASATIVQADIISSLDPRFTRPEQPGLTSAIFRNGMMMSRLSKAVYL